MNFGALPPEVNSARMYAGPGAGSMLAAAGAWDALAAELHSTAASYGSVISGLTASSWQGASSASMAAAAAPYMAWMSATAAQAEQVANQARAAASAYEAAFAMTVPPPVIAANRAQLMTLVATNFLGINTPAIMATEAHYGEMWAQDAAAMYGYAGSSAAASMLAPFTPPAHTTNPGGMAGQAAAVAHATGVSAGTHAHTVASSVPGHLASSVSTVPQMLQGLAQTMPSSSSSGLSSMVMGTGTSAAASGASTPASMLTGMMGAQGGKGALKAGESAGMGGALSGLLAEAAGDPAVQMATLGLIEDTVGLAVLDSGGVGLDLFGLGIDLTATGEVGEAAGELLPAGGLGGLGLVPAAGLGHLAPVGAMGGSGAAASMGHAAAIGGLTVPQSWASTPAAATSPAMPAAPMSSAGGPTPLPGTNLGAVPAMRPVPGELSAASGAAAKVEAGSSGKLFSEGLLASMAGRAIGGAAALGRRERVPAATGAPADGPPTVREIAAVLHELAELRDSGILTDEKFNEQIRRVLARSWQED